MKCSASQQAISLSLSLSIYLSISLHMTLCTIYVCMYIIYSISFVYIICYIIYMFFYVEYCRPKQPCIYKGFFAYNSFLDIFWKKSVLTDGGEKNNLVKITVIICNRITKKVPHSGRDKICSVFQGRGRQTLKANFIDLEGWYTDWSMIILSIDELIDM